MACKNIKKLFIDALEHSLSDEQQKKLDNHLASCADCRAELEKLSTVYTGTQNSRHPEMHDQKYWDRYWLQILSQVMEEKQAPRRARVFDFSFSHMAQKALAAATVLAISFVILVVHKHSLQPNTEPHSSAIMQSIVQDFLEQSKLLLMGIDNFENTSTDDIDFAIQRQASEDLIMQSAFLRKNMAMQSDQRLLSLLEELDVILLQIANTDNSTNPNAIDLIQYSVEQNSILFKINTEQMAALEKKNQSKKEI